MVQKDKKKTKIKIFMCGLAGTLALSMVQLPVAHATESCFESEDVLNSWDDPYRSGDVMIPVNAACEMKLYSLDVTFTDAGNVKGLNNSYATFWHDDISTISENGMRVLWNVDESEPQTRDGRPYIDTEAGEALLGYWYSIPSETTVFKHNMAVTINSARYELNGEMKTVENLVLDAITTITPDENKDVLMISGIEKQDVTYTGQPVVLEGDLVVEENNDNITTDDLGEQYYEVDAETGAETAISRPTDPGNYLVKYSFENSNYRASLIVPFTIKDYVIVDTEVWGGQGEVSAPRYVDMGGNLHVDIVPVDGYEVLWVEHNGSDVTNLLNEDNSLDIENVNEDAEIVVAFRPVYRVTSGDGNEYTKGGGNNLAFMIDKDPASYTSGIVTIAVDGEYIDLDNDGIVEPEAQTVTLLGDYLETLELGEHGIEIFFFDTDINGIARATFTVVEADEGETEDELVPVPDTGAFTTGSSSAETTGAIAVIAGTSLAFFLLAVKRLLKKKD